MIDSLTKTPFRVSISGDVAYIDISVDQLPEVRNLLDRHGIRYWVDETFSSFSGGPYKTIINFYRATDPTVVQSLLDGTR